MSGRIQVTATFNDGSTAYAWGDTVDQAWQLIRERRFCRGCVSEIEIQDPADYGWSQYCQAHHLFVEQPIAGITSLQDLIDADAEDAWERRVEAFYSH